MANNAASFAIQLDEEFARVVGGSLREITQKVALEALSRVVLKTPVDTGRARGNWHVSVGAPSLAEYEGREDRSGGETITRGAAQIEALIDPDVIYIQNNLPYIVRLENGYSKQAPTGMAALTVAELETMFQVVE